MSAAQPKAHIRFDVVLALVGRVQDAACDCLWAGLARLQAPAPHPHLSAHGMLAPCLLSAGSRRRCSLAAMCCRLARAAVNLDRYSCRWLASLNVACQCRPSRPRPQARLPAERASSRLAFGGKWWTGCLVHVCVQPEGTHRKTSLADGRSSGLLAMHSWMMSVMAWGHCCLSGGRMQPLIGICPVTICGQGCSATTPHSLMQWNRVPAAHAPWSCGSWTGAEHYMTVLAAVKQQETWLRNMLGVSPQLKAANSSFFNFYTPLCNNSKVWTGQPNAARLMLGSLAECPATRHCRQWPRIVERKTVHTVLSVCFSGSQRESCKWWGVLRCLRHSLQRARKATPILPSCTQPSCTQSVSSTPLCCWQGRTSHSTTPRLYTSTFSVQR